MDTIKIGKYMTAEPIGTEPHETYIIRSSNGSEIGHVEWYPRWKCHIFSPEFGAVLSHDCCADLARMLKALQADLQGLDIHTL